MSIQVPLRRLGRSGLTVSRLTLGTMTFGDRTDEVESQRIFNRAAEAGVNFIDTADVYAAGRSEEITGRLIAGRRDDFIIATKAGNPMGEGPNRRGLSRRWLHSAVEASLRRLDTDYIDILYLHRDDRDTPLEETARALDDLRRSGKIRYFGISNFRGWQIARLSEICRSEGMDGPVALQPVYHVLNRTAEAELLPVCAEYGIGVVTYSPTARGILTGKYGVDAPLPEGSRAALGNRRMMEAEFYPENIQAGARFAELARERGVDPVALATAWILANDLVTSVIAGPRTLDQWLGYEAAIECRIDAELETVIDAMVRAGTTAVPQFVDPNYPVEGRVVGA